MKQYCPNCGAPVSKRWLLSAPPSETYQCVQCKAHLEFTWKRYLVSFLAGLLGSLPIIVSFYYFKFTLGEFLIYYGIILIFDVWLILNMPGQFRLATSLPDLHKEANE